ncbi:hypothetical protein Tco_1060481 [Tanacetum coccineum]
MLTRIASVAFRVSEPLFKKDNGYHAVPPPLTGNYMPPLADLSFAGLDDSVYRPTANKTSAVVSQVEASTSQTSNTSVEMPRVESVRPMSYQNEKVNTARVNGVNTAVQTAVSTVKGTRVTAVKACRILQVILDLQHFKSSLFSLCSNSSSNFFSNPSSQRH